MANCSHQETTQANCRLVCLYITVQWREREREAGSGKDVVRTSQYENIGRAILNTARLNLCIHCFHHDLCFSQSESHPNTHTDLVFLSLFSPRFLLKTVAANFEDSRHIKFDQKLLLDINMESSSSPFILSRNTTATTITTTTTPYHTLA